MAREVERRGRRSPDSKNIHTVNHPCEAVAWLCRCGLVLVAANAANLLCPWWMSLSGAAQQPSKWACSPCRLQNRHAAQLNTGRS